MYWAMSTINPEEITQEKCLYDIFKKSLRMQYNRFNLLVVIFAVVSLSAYCAYTDDSTYTIIRKIRWMSDMGMSFVTNILGFLVAGFTIYATITDKSLFLHMAKISHPDYKVSYLKYSIFTFMYVFIMYIAFLLFCFATRILFDSHGTVPSLLKLNHVSYKNIKFICINTLFVILGAWITYLILLLKSFAFNIYHVVTVSIRWEYELQQLKLDEILQHQQALNLSEQQNQPSQDSIQGHT
jgi:hypothetical protein